MLRELTISGVALIDNLTIEFTPGFNVVTGETGAGKSILIRSLHFLMGGKVSADIIRQGFDQAAVLGHYTLSSRHECKRILEGLGIAVEKGGSFSLIIRRQLSRNGRSLNWINDVPVTVSSLREVGMTLVDMFGQHENQRLMDPGRHGKYLDAFLKDSGVVESFRKKYAHVMEALRAVKASAEALERGLRERDYIEYRVKALEALNPSEKDFEEVKRVTESGEEASKRCEALSHVLAALSGEAASVPALIREAAKSLPTSDAWGEWRERLLDTAKSVEELTFEVESTLSGGESEGLSLEEAQSRLFQYQDLFRKVNVKNISDLIQEGGRLQEALRVIHSGSSEIEAKLTELKKAAVSLKEEAEKLSGKRKIAANEMQRRVQGELRELAMPGAVFECAFHSVNREVGQLELEAVSPKVAAEWVNVQSILSGVGEEGSERVEFLFSANPGEPEQPLARIASGGELSRIMLALKRSLSVDAETCVLVFDEIDTGISGRVADVVGKKMKELATDFQVLCISHLPQVAVYADSHFRVEKKSAKKDRTESSIVRLSDKESAEEIARLLSGKDVSKESLSNAQSLIALAHGKKRKGNEEKAKPRMR